MPSAILRRRPMTLMSSVPFRPPWPRHPWASMELLKCATRRCVVEVSVADASCWAGAGDQLEIDVGSTGSLTNSRLEARALAPAARATSSGGGAAGAGAGAGSGAFSSTTGSAFSSTRSILGHGFRGFRSVSFAVNVEHDADAATDGQNVAGFTDDAGHGAV